MDEILEILEKDARISVEEMAKMLKKKPADVRKKVAQYEKDGIIIAYKAVINRELVKDKNAEVRASSRSTSCRRKTWALIRSPRGSILSRKFRDVSWFPEPMTFWFSSGAVTCILWLGLFPKNFLRWKTSGA